MQSASEILKQLNFGKIDVQEAAALLKKEETNTTSVKGSKKIKIKVRIDAEKNKTNINLPGLPIGFIEKIIIISFRMSRSFIKKHQFINIDVLDIKKLFDCLRFMPPTKIVEVDVEEDNTKVEIFTY